MFVLLCLAVLAWTGLCQAACPDLSAPQNGQIIIPNSINVGDVASYSCADGFFLLGNSQRVCQLEGSWSGSEPTCPGVCDSFPCLNGATCTPDGNSFVCTCTPGHIGTTCSQLVTCPDITAPQDGQISFSPNSNRFGVVASYTCDVGFFLFGDAQRTCQADGEWSGTEPTCPGVCESFPCLNGGNCAPDGNSFVCTCAPGHIGQTCDQIVRCPDITAPQDGEISFSPNNNHFGVVASYTCDDGFDLLGDSQRTCQGDGQWSGTEPTCQAVCPTLTDPENGQVRQLLLTTGKYLGLYTCNDGFFRFGDPQRECSDETGWSGSEPTCEAPDADGCPPGYSLGTDLKWKTRRCWVVSPEDASAALCGSRREWKTDENKVAISFEAGSEFYPTRCCVDVQNGVCDFSSQCSYNMTGTVNSFCEEDTCKTQTISLKCNKEPGAATMIISGLKCHRNCFEDESGGKKRRGKKRRGGRKSNRNKCNKNQKGKKKGNTNKGSKSH